MKRTPLKRKTPLKANPNATRAFIQRGRDNSRESRTSAPLKRTKGLNPRSAKRIVEDAKYKAARDPFMAANPICQCCRYRPATECHHKKGRIGKLLYDVRYFAALCRECHDHIHHVAPLWAAENGWLIGKDVKE